MKKIFAFFLSIICIHVFAQAQQSFQFAHISDTHIGSSNADEDLRRTVRDINSNPNISFSIISGDITDFGSDEEIKLAKQILDSLNKPWYIIPGNHDANWSESGSNTFKKVFGSEHFNFTYNGYLFIGTACGPNMRMSPGQVPREHIVWLDSLLQNMQDLNMPIIYVNHYPQDSSLNNWYEAVDLLKERNTQLAICGHGHSNRKLNFEGIPAVMGRSNLRAKKDVGGYNVVTIAGNNATYEERNPLSGEQRKWAEVALINHHFTQDTARYFRPSYSINNQYKKVKKAWSFQDNSDIGSGIAVEGNNIIASNSNGAIYALNKKSGKMLWSFQTGGKIYSTPAVENNLAVVGSTDNNIYCLDAATGKQVWKFDIKKPTVANPIIKNNTVYIGSSDGVFRAINLHTGKQVWDFDEVKGFVVTRPLFYDNKIYFGSWGTEFYALDAANGNLVWKWNNGSANRMFSPAACFPVAANGKIFIVAPDRYMTAFDAATGNVLWRKQDAVNRVRESMGLSIDSTLVYAKTMEGFVIGVSTEAQQMDVKWKANTDLNYEIAPTAIIESNGIVYVPSNSGVVAAVNRKDGKVIWKHKISNALVTNILPLDKKHVIVTTMDGKVTCLKFK